MGVVLGSVKHQVVCASAADAPCSGAVSTYVVMQQAGAQLLKVSYRLWASIAAFLSGTRYIRVAMAACIRRLGSLAAPLLDTVLEVV